MNGETLLVILIVSPFVILWAVVWVWAMWNAFTQGDDSIARFGRSILRRRIDD